MGQCAAIFDGKTWVSIKGEKGDPGKSLSIKGSVPTQADLPATGAEGDLWIDASTGDGYAWNATTGVWDSVGRLQGPAGVQGLKGDKGDTGAAGKDGAAASMRIGTVNHLPPGSTPTIANVGTTSAAVLDFGLVDGATGAAGPKGDPGTNASIAIGAVADGAPGTNAIVVNSGTPTAAVLDFTIPAGQTGAAGPIGPTGLQGPAGKDGTDGVTPTIAVGTTSTGGAGTSAKVADSGTAPNHVFDFTIPAGATGATGPAGKDGVTPTLKIGTVASGTSASATIGGTAPDYELSLTLVKGDAGPVGPQGPAGKDGSGVTIKGTVDGGTWPPAGPHAAGDMWLIGDPVPTGAPAGAITGHGMVYDGATWKDVGPIQGPAGPAGAVGPIGPAGPSAVSTDTGNAARLGTDSLIYVPTVTLPVAADDVPLALAATGAVGSSAQYAREDHIHPWPTPAQIGAAETAHTHAAAAITGLAAVAVSGQYADLAGKPAAYSLPTASAGTLGGVKIGTGIDINNGVISVSAGAGGTTVVDATTTVKGIVRLAAAADLTGTGSTTAVATAAQLVAATDGMAPLNSPQFVSHVSVPDGSATTPGYRFSDGDTGLYLSGAGTIAFSSNGVQSMRIGSTGLTVAAGLTAGGNTYPTTQGTAGQHLQTDGAGTLSWVDAVSPSPATKTTTGVISVGSGLAVTGAGELSVVWPSASTSQQGVISVADAAAIAAGTANRAVDAAALKTITDALPGTYVNVTGDAMTGSLMVPDGTAAFPAVTFDDATGIYQPAANTWAVATGGVERLRVRDTGMTQFFKPISIGIGPQANIGIFNYVSVVGSGSSGITGITSLPNVTGTTTGDVRVYDAACNLNGSVGNLYLFKARSAVSGTGSVTNDLVGFECENLPSSFGTSQIGFQSKLIDGAGRFNFYADGTAPNYFAGQVQTGLGTAAAPSVSFSGDTDTGTFSPGANTWAVSTGGVERLRVTGAGDLQVPSGYTPASPDSLVTKAYADNIASGGFTLDKASATVLGGIKIGSGLAIDADGVVSVDLQNLGGTTVTIPPGVDPALMAPVVVASNYISVAVQGTPFAGRIQLSIDHGTYPPPPAATGMVVQFRKQGDTDWTTGVVGYSNSSTQLADFAAYKATAGAVYCVWSFGGTVGETYEVRWAYESATGVGAWTNTLKPLVLGS